MMIRTICLSVACGLLGLALNPAALAAEKADPKKEAEAVVRAFNAAFTRKDIEGLAATLIEGGVQFDLRPAHADQTTPQGLTQEIRERWYGVTPILFAATESYTRQVEILDSHAAPDMATVWAKITTVMRMPKSSKPSTNVFTEVYLLVRTPQGWKIGAMMDDRATDSISIAGPAG
jgi:ketosteroid isomerase-like protein